MSHRLIVTSILFSISFSAAAMAQDAPAAGIKPAQVAVEISDEEAIKKASYLMAYNQIAQVWAQMDAAGVKLDTDQVLAGVRQAMSGERPEITQEEFRPVMEKFRSIVTASQQKKQQELMAKLKVEAEKNKAAGEAFMAENAKKEGVKVLPSGVQYKVLVEGTGAKPKSTDQVKINYHGTFVDGKVFDSTLEAINGKTIKPITHPANGFVEGFNSAIQEMPVGSKWEIVIPSEKAYGLGGRLGPNQTLVFQIELLDTIEKAEDAFGSAPNAEK